jgi:hypothetical protein
MLRDVPFKFESVSPCFEREWTKRMARRLGKMGLLYSERHAVVWHVNNTWYCMYIFVLWHLFWNAFALNLMFWIKIVYCNKKRCFHFQRFFNSPPSVDTYAFCWHYAFRSVGLLSRVTQSIVNRLTYKHLYWMW